MPFDGLPNVLDPDEGFVVTANQAVVGPEYPYYLTADWDRGYRSERIRDLLEKQGVLSVDDMAAIQLDTRSPLAATLVPRLLAIDLPRGYDSAGQRMLRTWDFDQAADSAPAEYFNVVWRNLLEMTFHDEMSEDVWPYGGDRWFAVVSGLLEEPDSTWWDDRDTTDVVEDRDDILRAAMIEARDEVTKLDAVSVEGWEWGHLHHLDLENSTLGDSGIGPVEWLVNRGGWEVGGSSAAVDAAGWNAAEDYTVDFAPSMRMVVSLADFDDSRWVNLTGVSGHPFSDHYTDQTDLWVEGKTLPWLFSRDCRRGRRRAHVDAGARPLSLVEPRGRPRPSVSRNPREVCGPVTGSRDGLLRSPPRPAIRTMQSARRHGAGDRAVVGLDGDVEADLVVVQQHPDGRADRYSGQRAVVAAAAAAHPISRGRDGEAGDQQQVGGTDGVRPQAPADRLEQAHPGRGEGRRPLVRRPVEVEVRQHDGQHHALAQADEGVDQGGGAGLGADRDVRRHGGRASYLRGRQHVLGDGPRGVPDLEQPAPVAGGHQLVAQGELGAVRRGR